jgi:response regulator RpfG family c-di-GMP phosphodiesterase
MNRAANVLVVDDELAIRELLVDVLSDTDYELSTCDDGESALKALKQDDFDLILTDIMMPGIDGIELIRAAKQLKPDIIPLVMTGYGTLDTARAAVKEGAYDYVLKPFNVAELKFAIANAFERKRLIDENARLKEITDLLTISEAVNMIHDEKELLSTVLEFALAKVGAARGSIMIHDPSVGKLRIAAGVGIPEDVMRTAETKIGEGIAGRVAESGQALLVTDIEGDPALERVSHKLPDKSFVSVPLEKREDIVAALPVRTSKRVLGVLNVSKKREGKPFSESDLKVLSILANQAAISLENVRLLASVEEAYVKTMQSLALLLEARDAYTSGHSQRVTELSTGIAARMGLPDDEIERLRLAASLHDIGKVGIPDNILNKAGKLTHEEYDMIKNHPIIGFQVLQPIEFLGDAKDIVRSHHERQDGNGYPDGIPASDLPLTTRIIIVVDAYDAMASDRAYRKARTDLEIIDELTAHRGSQFDPTVADELVSYISERSARAVG